MGEIVVERCQRDVARGQCRHIRLVWRRRRRGIVRGPVIRAAPGIDPSLEGLAVAGDTHRHDPQFRRAAEGPRRDVDVVEAAGRRAAGEQTGQHLPGDLRGPVVIGMLIPLERHGDARDSEKCPLDRGGHRARVEHVDAGVESAVDPADDEVWPPRAELGDAQLDGVGRTAVDRPAAAPRAVEDLLRCQGSEKRDRMPHTALLRRWGDDAHITEPSQGPLQGRQTGGKDSIVVGEQRQHGDGQGGVGKERKNRWFDSGQTIAARKKPWIRPVFPSGTVPLY